MVSQGTLDDGLLSTSNPSRCVSLAMLRPHHVYPSKPSLNLKERGLEWLTIPAIGEAIVTHGLSMSRLFAHAGMVEGGELKAGERFKMHMSGGYIGTSWWCWGDLEGDLKDKPFHGWQKGFQLIDAPFPADPDNWTLGGGGDISLLKFEDHSGSVEFEGVE